MLSGPVLFQSYLFIACLSISSTFVSFQAHKCHPTICLHLLARALQMVWPLSVDRLMMLLLVKRADCQTPAPRHPVFFLTAVRLNAFKLCPPFAFRVALNWGIVFCGWSVSLSDLFCFNVHNNILECCLEGSPALLEVRRWISVAVRGAEKQNVSKSRRRIVVSSY